ncbi:MAG: hypothetical protein WKF73_05265 [Nocardioidaceae bacterium]
MSTDSARPALDSLIAEDGRSDGGSAGAGARSTLSLCAASGTRCVRWCGETVDLAGMLAESGRGGAIPTPAPGSVKFSV